MNLSKENIDDLKNYYVSLYDENQQIKFRMLSARSIVEAICDLYRTDTSLIKKFETLVEENTRKYNKRLIKFNNYNDTFMGFVNFLIKENILDKTVKSYYGFVYKETSSWLHGKKGNPKSINLVLGNIELILDSFFEKYKGDFRNSLSKEDSFGEIEKSSQTDETDKKDPFVFESEPKKDLEIESNPTPNPKTKRFKYAFICSVAIICVLCLLYLLKPEGSLEAINDDNPISEFKVEVSDSTEQKQGSIHITNQESNEEKTDIVQPTSSGAKTDKKLKNNYILVKVEEGSEKLDPLLLNTLTEKYRKQYQFIMENSSSLNSTNFEFRSNFKTNYKASEYTEGIVSCNVSFSYQIIDSTDQSILENHFSEASGIGPSESSAKQNAIQKLKI